MTLDILVVSMVVLITLLLMVFGILAMIYLKNFNKLVNKIVGTVGTFSKELNRSRYESELQSRDCIRKLSDFINSHMWNFKSKLFEMACEAVKPTEEVKNELDVVTDLITDDLQYKLLNNFTENHIGNSNEEIEIYTRIRTKEYSMRILSIVDEYTDKVLTQNKFKEFIKELPDSFLYDRLLRIYQDGKLLERSIKGEFNK